MHTNNFNSNSQTWSWFQPPPRNQQPPLPLPPFVDPFVIQQLLGSQANAMHYYQGSTPMHHLQYSLPFSVGPIYQGMAQHQHQYRAPSSGPSRNRRSKGRRKTEAQYRNSVLHELSGAITRDHPTGTHPDIAWMGTFNNPGTGGAWRPPSRNPSMVDRNSTRVTPYDRSRSGTSRNRRQRSDNVDLSIYEMPITGSESSSNIPAVITAPAPPSMPSTSVHASTPSPSSQSTSTTSEMSDEDANTNTHTNEEEQPVEEDDFDTISLGSDTDYQY